MLAARALRPPGRQGFSIAGRRAERDRAGPFPRANIRFAPKMSSEEDKHDTFEAPKVSEEFSLGNVHTGLEKIRTRLLDLTARNKLLNFRHPKTSCLRFVDTALDTVFQYLMEGNPFTVEAVPEPDGLVRGSGGPLIDDAQEEDKIPSKGLRC